jgi:hypothetical protein
MLGEFLAVISAQVGRSETLRNKEAGMGVAGLPGDGCTPGDRPGRQTVEVIVKVHERGRKVDKERGR